MFKEITNRDAWSTIRGFVYQVDLTILRWLNLAEGETLELERGEDIDIISGGLDHADRSRILEQVKYRESSVSLNTDLATDLLFNFFVHRKNNPGQKLLFRFVSNAGYVLERPELFTKGKKGIIVWQELFADPEVSETDVRIQVIKNLLVKRISERITDSSKTKDKDKPSQQLWADFKAFVEDSTSLLSFIQQFEWSLEGPDTLKISEDVKQKIIESPYFSQGGDVGQIYPRLFMYVFKLLTNGNLKVLDIASLKSQTLLTALDGQDETIFKIVSDLLNELQEKVSKIEGNIVSTLAQMKILTEEVSSVKSSDAVFEVRLQNLSSEPPAILQNGSQRAVKTKELIDSFDETPWINLEGINGTGKTQLALLTCQGIDNVCWIDLREYNNSSEKSALYIEAILAFVSGIHVKSDRHNWMSMVFKKLPKNTIILINDLPKIDNTGSLKNLLTAIASNLSGKKVRFLTTSNYKIPTSLINTLQRGTFKEYNDFSFSDDEVKELLIKNGAPQEVLKVADLFASMSHRNPQILFTIVCRMVAMNWGKDSTDVFEELFKKEFSRDILRDAQSSISRFITDIHMKELLYRLSLIHWGYSFDIVSAVSEADKQIEFPFEKLQGITNTWIQESGTFYKTSPLIHDLGVQNLNPDTLKATYSAIARTILKTKKVDIISASRVITAFIKAENYNEAGIVLLTLLQSAQNATTAKNLFDWGYLDYWSGEEMPSAMSKSIIAHITVDQIRLRKIIGKDVTVLQARLNRTITGITDLAEKTIIAIIILANEAAINLDQYLLLAKFILENSDKLPDLVKEGISPQLLEGIVWMPLQQVETDDEVSSWLQLSELYEAKTGVSFYENEIAETGVTVLANHIVKFERKKENFEALRLSERLDKLIEYFYKKGFETIAASIIKERITLQFILLGDPQRAEKMTVEWSEEFRAPEAKYLLYENLGKLYYTKRKDPKNIFWLQKAININCETHATFPDTLAYGAASKSDTYSATAVNYMERAVVLTKKMDWATELDLVQMICELAVAYWKNNEFKKSYDSFNDALTRLQVARKEPLEPYWIRLMCWMAHSLGYIAADIAKDKLPSYFSDGDEYIKPYQGIFLFNTQDLSDLYTTNKDVLMLAQMATFSEGVGDIDGSYKWSLRAFDEARKTGDESLVMMVLISCNQYTLLNFKFEEHFEMAMRFHAVSSHLSGTAVEKYEQSTKFNYEELLKSKPSEAWDSAEDTIFTLSVLPMFIMVQNQYNNDGNGEGSAKALLKLIKNYSEKASYIPMWEKAYSLTDSIFCRTVTISELINQGNKYSKTNEQNLETLCILGRIFLERDSRSAIVQVVNVFPFFTRNFCNMPAIVRNILVPFVKFYSIKAINENFVGSKIELAQIIDETTAGASAKSNAVQKTIKNAVAICEITVTGDRKEWLEHYKEI